MTQQTVRLAIPEETIILIEGLSVQAHVGVGAVERRATQAIEFDLELQLANPTIPRDRMEDSVNYATVVQQIETLCRAERHCLLETMAERIAEMIFVDTRVRRVLISLRKPRKLANSRAVGIRRVFRRASEGV